MREGHPSWKVSGGAGYVHDISNWSLGLCDTSLERSELEYEGVIRQKGEWEDQEGKFGTE